MVELSFKDISQLGMTPLISSGLVKDLEDIYQSLSDTLEVNLTVDGALGTDSGVIPDICFSRYSGGICFASKLSKSF